MPFTRPDPDTQLPKFAATSGIIDPVSQQPNIQTPDTTYQTSGWTLRQYAPRQFFNWLHHWTYKWLGWLDQYTQAIKAELTVVETAVSNTGATLVTIGGEIDTLQAEVETANTGLLDLVTKPSTGLMPRVTVLESYAQAWVNIPMDFYINGNTGIGDTKHMFTLRALKTGLLVFLRFPADTFNLTPASTTPAIMIADALYTPTWMPTSGTFLLSMIVAGVERAVQATISVAGTNRLMLTFKIGATYGTPGTVDYNGTTLIAGIAGFSAQTVTMLNLV